MYFYCNYYKKVIGLSFFFPDDENCTTCDSILQILENIDDDSDRYGVQMLKTDDTAFAVELGISQIPSFVYFENQIPSIYDGRHFILRSSFPFLVCAKCFF